MLNKIGSRVARIGPLRLELIYQMNDLDRFWNIFNLNGGEVGGLF